MKQAVRIALLALLLAALPLRGYAGVLMALCEGQHGGAATEAHAHEHGEDHHDHTADTSGGSTHAASTCSFCASCCAGAGVAPDVPRIAVFQSPGSDRIAFSDRCPSGFIPEHLDRPPLSS